MRLVQILLPIYSNTGAPFEQKLFTDLRDELVERFGGITAYTRAPVHGLWQECEQVIRDDLIIYEIMVEPWDERWWRELAGKPFPATVGRGQSPRNRPAVKLRLQSSSPCGSPRPWQLFFTRVTI